VNCGERIKGWQEVSNFRAETESALSTGASRDCNADEVKRKNRCLDTVASVVQTGQLGSRATCGRAGRPVTKRLTLRVGGIPAAKPVESPGRRGRGEKSQKAGQRCCRFFPAFLYALWGTLSASCPRLSLQVGDTRLPGWKSKHRGRSEERHSGPDLGCPRRSEHRDGFGHIASVSHKQLNNGRQCSIFQGDDSHG
jgi:hypothetical protein